MSAWFTAPQPKRSRTWLTLGLPLSVVLGSLLLTVLIWQRAEHIAHKELQTYFDFRTRDALNRVEERLKVYEQVLKGAHGFMAAPDHVSRNKFRTYVGSLELEKRYPGIQGVGYSKSVAPKELQRHIAEVRSEGFPDYTVRPEGPRERYSSIIYLEPFAGRNLRAFGYDMFSESVRRQAMQRACDAGETALSAKVTLVQETSHDVQAGVLLYLPLYGPGPTPTDLDTRRARLRGWVYAPLRMNDFLQGVLGEQASDLDIEIYDHDPTVSANLLFDKKVGEQIAPDPQGLSSQTFINFGGQRWAMRLKALPSMRDRLHQSPPWIILSIGGVLGALLGLLTWQLAQDRDQALRHAALHQARYREVMAQSKDAIILMTPEGRILEISLQTSLLLGLRSEDLVGRTVKELLREEVRDQILAALEEARNSGSCHFETTLRRADGRIVPIEASLTLTLFGGESQLLGVVRDIGERKEHEARLASEHQRLSDILRGTRAGIWEWEVQTGRVQFNDRWAEMLGYSLAELEPTSIQTWMDLAHPDDLERSGALLQAHFDGKLDDYECEARMKHRDGHWIWVLDRGRVVAWTKDGQPQLMSGTHQEITETKQAQAALIESEARYRSYVDSAPEAIFVADERGNYLDVNEAACRITGYSAQELLAMNLRTLISPEDQEPAMAHFTNLQRAGWASGEFRYQPKTGTPGWWAVKAVKLSENRFLAHVRDITEERGLRRALEEREENFRSFFESMDDFLFVGSLDGRVLFTNRAIQEKLGFGPQEWAAMQLVDLHPEALRAEATEIFGAMFRGERDLCPLPLRTRTGAQIPAETRVWFGHWSGEPCIYGISKDLSKQEAAHQKFNRLFEVNPTLIALSNAEGRFIEVNPAFVNTLGYSRDEVLGRTAAEVGLMVDGERHLQIQEQAISNGRFSGEELKVRCKDGSIRTGIFSGALLGIETQPHLLTVMMDFTEPKRLQEELERLSDQQRTILENTSIGIAFFQENRLAWCNRSMEVLFGYSQEELCLLDPARLYARWEDCAQVQREGHTAMMAGRPYGLDLRMQHRDGSAFWARLEGRPIDTQHPERGSIWSFDDITTRLEAEQALSDLNERLELRVEEELEKNRQQERLLIAQSRQAAMGEMIGHIAHQWRQPLSALGLVFSNIRDAHRFNRLTPEFMEKAREDSQRLIQKMSTTINDFMNFFRKDKGLTIFGVAEQVRQAVALVQASLSHHSIGIHIQAAGDFQVLGSPGEFSQVLLNLLTNAKEAILAGEAGEGEVRILLEAGPAVGLIQIQDNGGGIPAEILDRIFDPYYSTKEMGTGLGLYMSRMIVEHNMGGQLRAKNLEKGAEFSISLPLAKEIP